ncbi:hypothetical protein OSTOST_13921 [Ostertagia ostertagi]
MPNLVSDLVSLIVKSLGEALRGTVADLSQPELHLGATEVGCSITMGTSRPSGKHTVTLECRFNTVRGIRDKPPR